MAGLCTSMAAMSLNQVSAFAGQPLPGPRAVRLSSTTPRQVTRMAQSLQGKVVSTKSEKTVVVAVDRMVPHPLYKKRCRVTKNYKVHVEAAEAEVELGDIVMINPCKPVSKSKRFALGTTLKKRK